MKRSSFALAVLVPLVGVLCPYACPRAFVLWMSLIDFYVPDAWFDIHTSPTFEKYHSWLVDRLPDIAAHDALEINADHPDFENELARISPDWERPVVVRGGARGSAAYKQWHDATYWLTNWRSEEVLAYGSKAVEFTSVGDFIGAVQKNMTPSAYIGSASSVFTRNPALEKMADSPMSDRIEATLPVPEGKRSIAQLFMGVPGMTTQPHCDLGANVFRQVVGSKRWFWSPQSQSPLMWPKLEETGLVSASNTHITVSAPHGDKEESRWFRKAERYTALVNAGDVVISPPWWWHSVTNCPHAIYCPEVPETPFIISVASQHGHGKSGFMSNPVWTLNGALSILWKWGSMSNFQEKFNRKHVVGGRDAFERAQVATSNAYLQAAREL